MDVAEAEAISDADEVELMLRALNAMVPVPKRRRTRDRLPDAEDDVARAVCITNTGSERPSVAYCRRIRAKTRLCRMPQPRAT